MFSPIQVGETWNNGPCRACECYGNLNEGFHYKCNIKECILPNKSVDYDEFRLESVPILNECCAEITRTGCKYNGEVYDVGEKWNINGNYCALMECVNTTIGLQKLTQVTACETNCDLGYEYVEASLESRQCCGGCKQIACVVDGVIKNVDEEWTSPDYCVKYICKNLNGSVSAN